jgi:hypothetical protein
LEARQYHGDPKDKQVFKLLHLEQNLLHSKKAVEEGITLQYYLRSMGIKVGKPTPIFVDNIGVVLNASNPGSTLKKKSEAFSYHFVQEHVANDVMEIRKIDTADNYADQFTKALTSNEHHRLFYDVKK